MCITAKIEEIQIALMGQEFPKSGYNKFSKNNYHELKDIMPPIVAECHKRGLMLLFNFSKDEATLDVTDKNNVENYYRFTMPMPEIGQLNKQMNVIQSIGADSTYLKRYLLINAFLILEDDVADALEPTDNEPVEDKPVEAEKPKKSKKSKNPVIIYKALSELKKEGVEIDKNTVWAKCNQIGLNDENRREVINWITKNLQEGK